MAETPIPGKKISDQEAKNVTKKYWEEVVYPPKAEPAFNPENPPPPSEQGDPEITAARKAEFDNNKMLREAQEHEEELRKLGAFDDD
jgi:hypothetical protein